MPEGDCLDVGARREEERPQVVLVAPPGQPRGDLVEVEVDDEVAGLGGRPAVGGAVEEDAHGARACRRAWILGHGTFSLAAARSVSRPGCQTTTLDSARSKVGLPTLLLPETRMAPGTGSRSHHPRTGYGASFIARSVVPSMGRGATPVKRPGCEPRVDGRAGRSYARRHGDGVRRDARVRLNRPDRADGPSTASADVGLSSCPGRRHMTADAANRGPDSGHAPARILIEVVEALGPGLELERDDRTGGLVAARARAGGLWLGFDRGALVDSDDGSGRSVPVIVAVPGSTWPGCRIEAELVGALAAGGRTVLVARISGIPVPQPAIARVVADMADGAWLDVATAAGIAGVGAPRASATAGNIADRGWPCVGRIRGHARGGPVHDPALARRVLPRTPAAAVRPWASGSARSRRADPLLGGASRDRRHRFPRAGLAAGPTERAPRPDRSPGRLARRPRGPGPLPVRLGHRCRDDPDRARDRCPGGRGRVAGVDSSLPPTVARPRRGCRSSSRPRRRSPHG